MPNDYDGKTTCSDSFLHIERSERICNIWRGCNAKCVARYDHQLVLSTSTEACMLFLLSKRALHRNVAVTCIMISVDFKLDVVHVLEYFERR